MERARLSSARNEKGWSQEYLAERVGVERITVQRWEAGRTNPQPPHQIRLCKLFEKTAQELGLADETVSSVDTVVDATGLPHVNDAYSAFQTSDLTTRLQSLVWSWLFRNNDARYHEGLQTAIRLALEPKDNTSMNEDSISRRDAIRRLATLPIEYCGLSLFMPILLRPIAEILALCAAGVTACWYLRKGKDLSFVADTLSRYIPTLREIAKISSAVQRKEATELLAQCLLLQSELAMHVSSNNTAIQYAEQAGQYAEVADNPILQILAARRLEAAHWYIGHWEQALQNAQKAKYLLEATQDTPIPQRVRSYVYAGLASDQAYFGQKQDALASLKKAHAAFFDQSSREPDPVWIDNHSRANLVLNDGLTYMYLGMGQEAFDSFGQITRSFADSEVIRVEAMINQVMAEVQRDDKPRSMEVCIDLWVSGMQGAIALQSEQWFNEARMAYTAMCAAWPSEQRIKKLREQIIHW